MYHDDEKLVLLKRLHLRYPKIISHRSEPQTKKYGENNLDEFMREVTDSLIGVNKVSLRIDFLRFSGLPQ